MATYAVPLFLGLVLAAAVSLLAARYRAIYFEAGGVEVAYASLWRRYLAALIDLVLVVAPPTVLLLQSFESRTDSGR